MWDNLIAWVTDGDVALGLITVLAIIVGPICAARIAAKETREYAQKDARKERQLELYSTLMRTRHRTIDPDPEYVGAINMLGHAFADHKEVIDALSAYLQVLNSPEGISRDAERRRERQCQQVLFSEIAKALDIEVLPEVILKGYYPPTLADKDYQDVQLWSGLTKIARGDKPILTQSVDVPAKYIPPTHPPSPK